MTITAMFSAALPIGIGATVVMDVWGLLLRRLGVATLDFAMVGRWAGHLLGGRVRHQAIAKAEPVRHELALGGDSLRHRCAVRNAAGCHRRGGLVAVAYFVTCSSCWRGYGRGTVVLHAAGDGGGVLCVQDAEACAKLS